MDTISTADLFDEYADSLVSVPLQFQDLGGVAGFHGTIRTVVCYEDNALIRELLATPGHGSVLVIDGGGSLNCALVGDRLAMMAVDNGWAGLIVHGAVRDRQQLGTLPLGVKALGSNPARSSQTGAGQVDVTVVIANVEFHVGSEVWCDADGIVVTKA